MRMRLLYLDVDGVLSGDARSAFQQIHQENVRWLNVLLEKAPPDVRIVLSTSWRYTVLQGSMTLTGFEHMLRSHGAHVGGRIVGTTRPDEDYDDTKTNLWMDQQTRVTQVLDDVRARGDEVISFACVDNMPLRFEGLERRFVQTDEREGLQEQDVGRLVTTLKEDLTDEERKALCSSTIRSP